MNSKHAIKPRLGRGDWLDAALDELKNGGINAIAIEKLAVQLGVTRGSFYHHFRGRVDLLTQMLDYWAEHWTLEIHTEITVLGLDARQTLLALIRMIRHRKAAEYDVVFRAWALHDPVARKVVKRVDEFRLDYIRSLFGQLGFNELEAENRARLFLYYEMTEPAMFATQSKKTREKLIEARHRLLTTDSDRTFD
jgi:AcrR family transcriptional regulator